MIADLIILLVGTLLIARFELYYDKKLIEAFSTKIVRSKLQNYLIHEGQLLPRGVVLLLFAGNVAPFPTLEWMIYSCFAIAVYWPSFDIMIARSLGKRAWFTGTTSKTDQWLKGRLGLGLKVLLAIAMAIIAYRAEYIRLALIDFSDWIEALF